MAEQRPLTGTPSLSDLCLGIVLARLLGAGEPNTLLGRPSLAAVLRWPAAVDRPLADLGIDSLSWMEAMTQIESELQVQVDGELLAGPQVTARMLAQAFAHALALAPASHHP